MQDAWDIRDGEGAGQEDEMSMSDRGEVGQDEGQPPSHAGAAGPSAFAGAAGPSELPDASQSTSISEHRRFLFSLTNEQRAILSTSYHWSHDTHHDINKLLREEFNSNGTAIPGTDRVDEEARRSEVRRVLVELFNVSPNEMVSLHLLR